MSTRTRVPNKCHYCDQPAIAGVEHPVCYVHSWGPETTPEQALSNFVGAVREIEAEIKLGKR